MKTAINEITGASIVSKSSEAYRENYDRIFRKENNGEGERIFGKKESEKKEKPLSYIILKNSIQCKKCGDIIESKHVHDFVYCSCHSCGVDGGRDYLRYIGNPEDYIDLSEVISQEEDDWFEKVRETFTWSSRGKLGNEPLKQILLKDLTGEHIMCILDDQWHIKNTVVEEYLKKELEYRSINA